MQVFPDAGQSPLLILVSGAQSELTKEHVQALERILKESGRITLPVAKILAHKGVSD